MRTTRISLLLTLVMVVITMTTSSCSDNNENSLPKEDWTIAGTYRIQNIKWDGQEIDLNNTGIAKEPTYSDIFGGGWLGIQPSKDYTPLEDSRVFPYIKGIQSPAQISLYAPQGEFTKRSALEQPKIKKIYLNTVTVYYQPQTDGTYIFVVPPFNTYTREEANSYKKDIEITFPSDGIIVMSYTTMLWDYATQQGVEGRITIHYKRTSNEV